MWTLTITHVACVKGHPCLPSSCPRPCPQPLPHRAAGSSGPAGPPLYGSLGPSKCVLAVSYSAVSPRLTLHSPPLQLSLLTPDSPGPHLWVQVSLMQELKGRHRGLPALDLQPRSSSGAEDSHGHGPWCLVCGLWKSAQTQQRWCVQADGEGHSTSTQWPAPRERLVFVLTENPFSLVAGVTNSSSPVCPAWAPTGAVPAPHAPAAYCWGSALASRGDARQPP